MTVKSAKFNSINNISWFKGNYTTPTVKSTQNTKNLVVGNPNRPVVLNNDPYAGPIVTFDRLG